MCAGDGHTEAIRIEYDPEKLSYERLVESFFEKHMPFPAPAQYKSAIWYHDDEQKLAAEHALKQRNVEHVDLQPATKWHDAEEYHQKYYEKQVPWWNS